MRPGPAQTGAFPAHLPALTSLRFLLAAGVALFHYQLFWAPQTADVTGLIERARLGLDVFFILSGFILTHVHARALAEGRYRHGPFLIARLARIYPMHLAALGLFAAMVLAATAAGAPFDRAAYPWPDLLRALTLTQAWTPDPRPIQWNGPSWSLSAEWFAYLAFPLFAWLGLKAGRRPWLLIALALLIFAAFDVLYQGLYGRILTRAEEALGLLRIVPEFLFGVALYRLGEQASVPRTVAIGAASLAGGLVLVLMHASADDRVIVLAAGPLILSLAWLSRAGADGLLARPWMLAAGEASYAFYLLHMPLLIGWRGGARMLGRPDDYAMPLWEVAGLLTLTGLAALTAHRLWERPARRWIRAWAARWTARPAPSPATPAP